MTQQEFIQEMKKRFKTDDRCFFYEAWEPRPERTNGAPIPSGLLEVILFSTFSRTFIRIGCYGNHTKENIGTKLKIDVNRIEVQKEVISQYKEPFYRFSQETKYDGDFQKKGGTAGEIDFDGLEFILRDQTDLAKY